MAGLEANEVEGDAIPAGMRGGISGTLLAALDSKVLSKKPRWMTLSCGTDEIWSQSPDPDDHDADAAPVATGETSLESFKKNISQIVDRALAAGIQVVILTVAGKGDDPACPENLKLAPYNDFRRTIAGENHLRLVDLNGLFQERVKAEKARQTGDGTKSCSTLRGPDGLHLRFGGNIVIATGILQPFGLNAEEMKKAQAVWERELAAGKAAADAERIRAQRATALPPPPEEPR